MLDGFVLETLDTISNTKSFIKHQLKLRVDFAFVTNNRDIKKVEKCFVQFKTFGQCLNFISKYNFDVIKTDSNGQSLNYFKEHINDPNFSAIIPMHYLNELDVITIKKHIADSKGNQTRFVILEPDRYIGDWKDIDVRSYIDKKVGKKNKFIASFVITSEYDKPGILFDILSKFHDLNINMNSLLSRPLKTHMGEYKFFIEATFDIDAKDKLIKIIKSLASNYKTDLLGVYNTL
jgi:prephenate dehydratase